MNNAFVAKVFRDIARILEIKADNPFRIRAYERAAQNIEGLGEDISNFLKQERLRDIPGVGSDLADKIQEIAQTGKLKFLEDLKKDVPEGILELLNIPSVGPKTAKVLYEQAGIKSIEELQRAIIKNKLQGIFGIKQKTIENIQHGIELLKRGKERMSLAQACTLSEEFVHGLKKVPAVRALSPAGSVRRQKETVRDIDILITSDSPAKVMDGFLKLPQVTEVIARGLTKSSVRTSGGVQVDCRVVKAKSFGAALLYFTGSKNFNIKIRQLAIKKGLKINEYGIFKKDKFLAGTTENEVFKALGLSYIEPELREDTGEIELAKKSALPRLLCLQDIKADFHLHSLWSDGNNSIRDMANAAQKKGYSYVAITDHSQGLKVAGGLSIQELKEKKKEIDSLNKTLKNFRILFATEVDIDSQGSLDYKDDVLQGFDIVVAAIHSGFKQSRQQVTKRIVKACQNKYVHIIAHPTGRLWGERDGYEFDFQEVCKVAHQTNTCLEINSFPQRLDLDSVHCKAAKERGVKIAISTDAHTVDQLDNMRFGVAVARRGWLTCDDVLNSLSLEELFKTIKK